MLPHSATAKKIWRSRSLMRLPIRPSQSMALAIKDRLLGQRQNDHSIYITAAYGFNHTPCKDRPWTNRSIRQRLGAALIPPAAPVRELSARAIMRRVLAATDSSGDRWTQQRARELGYFGYRQENKMNSSRRRCLYLVAGAAALPMVSRVARAQAYPSRPVRLIVPFASGGGADVLARLSGQWLAERLGQPFIIDNRPGAGGNIAPETGGKGPAGG